MSRPTQTRRTGTPRRDGPARLQLQGGRGGRLRAAPTRSRRSRLWIAVAILVLVLMAIVRLITITPPDVKLARTADPVVRLSGRAPTPDWPSSGAAAFKVLGVGSLGSSGGTTPRPTASLAKVMTAYLILEHHPLSAGDNGFTLTLTQADVNATAADIAEDQSVVEVAAGERLNERQLLEALLIPSGNNIARILAAYQAGSVSAFVAEMNREARALGMTHTTYTDPSGFDATTVSTAADQLKVFTRAMRFKVFREIVKMPSVTLPVAGTVANFDPLMDAGYYGKTGSDSAAEGCLAFFRYVRVDGRRVTEVGVVMGQGTGADTYAILDAAGDAASALAGSVTPAIRAHTVLAAGTSALNATAASGARTRGVADSSLRVIGWGGLRERLKVTRAAVTDSLTHGQRIGTVRLAGSLPTPRDGATSASVRAASTLPAPGLGWRIAHLF